MDHRLHFLESFSATGSDGTNYKVCGYERTAPDAPFTHGNQTWESTGVAAGSVSKLDTAPASRSPVAWLVAVTVQ